MTQPIMAPGAPPGAADRTALLHRKAAELESVFLAEMLAQAGVGETEGSFGGGAGEAQFASFLRQAQSQAIVAHGGVGLSESLFRALVRADGHGG